MCGIAGAVNFSDERMDPEIIRRMVEMVRHRGPDDTGLYVDDRAGLAHVRLSIIDLEGGAQPMHNEDRTLWITFNGEIFNYLELREELLQKGHRFATRSDTEVILHLFEEKGEECVKSLNGQWAFAIWDVKAKRLFMSRDRLGIRPLFYTTMNDTFLFGSEIKSIFAHPAASRNLDFQALDQVFSFWFSLPPRTIFRDVMELPPGHSLVLENRVVRIRRYWELDFSRVCGFPDSLEGEQEVADRLLELLKDSTRIRLRSDVPVGAYLSGGLDSTVTTALIRNFTDARLRTFSVTFDDPEFDESSYQREAVAYLNTDHQEVHCANAEIGRIFPEVIWHTEKPILRTAPAPLYLLSKLVRENGYKVVLTGEGADEVLGGYDIFKEAKVRKFWSTFPNSRIRPLLLKKLYPYLPNLQAQSASLLKGFFHLTPEDTANPFFSHLPRWEMTSQLKAFFSETVRAAVGNSDVYARMREMLPAGYDEWDWFSKAQYLEGAHLLPGYILSSQGDRMAMAHSVEGRFPFLDYRVVEFACSLPPRLKMKVMNEKYILKKCAADLIPPRVKNRTKQPYRAPEGKSFFGETGRATQYLEDLLSPAGIQRDGVFSANAVLKLVEKFRTMRAIGIKDNMALVGILSTQLVVDQFVNNFPTRVSYGNARERSAAVYRQ